MNKKLVVGLVFLVLIAGFLFFYYSQKPNPQSAEKITNFQECVDAGFPVMESYPEQCSNGQETFTRDIGNELEKTDVIRIGSPRPGELIFLGETYELSGEARGYWFFEASFPFEIVSKDGEQLFSHYATAEEEWMTEEFVPFTSEFVLSGGEEYVGPATLILRRDNPSGLSENDDELIVPIVIRSNLEEEIVVDESAKKDIKIEEKQPTDRDDEQRVTGSCFVGGCSGQICSDESGVMSTCEWRPEYQCYQNARCERQNDGLCGWTQTQELLQCLSSSGGEVTM
jgi:hypothetical protein